MIRARAYLRSRSLWRLPLHAQALPVARDGRSRHTPQASSSTPLPPSRRAASGSPRSTSATGRRLTCQRRPSASRWRAWSSWRSRRLTSPRSMQVGARWIARSITLDERNRSGSDGIGKLMPHPGVTLVGGQSDRADADRQRQYCHRHADRRSGGTTGGAALAVTQPHRRHADRSRNRAAWCSTISVCRCFPARPLPRHSWASDPLSRSEARAAAVAGFDSRPARHRHSDWPSPAFSPDSTKARCSSPPAANSCLRSWPAAAPGRSDPGRRPRRHAGGAQDGHPASASATTSALSPCRTVAGFAIAVFTARHDRGAGRAPRSSPTPPAPSPPPGPASAACTSSPAARSADRPRPSWSIAISSASPGRPRSPNCPIAAAVFPPHRRPASPSCSTSAVTCCRRSSFAERLEGWRDGGKREARFLIGAADGHNATLRGQRRPDPVVRSCDLAAHAGAGDAGRTIVPRHIDPCQPSLSSRGMRP